MSYLLITYDYDPDSERRRRETSIGSLLRHDNIWSDMLRLMELPTSTDTDGEDTVCMNKIEIDCFRKDISKAISSTTSNEMMNDAQAIQRCAYTTNASGGCELENPLTETILAIVTPAHNWMKSDFGRSIDHGVETMITNITNYMSNNIQKLATDFLVMNYKVVSLNQTQVAIPVSMGICDQSIARSLSYTLYRLRRTGVTVENPFKVSIKSWLNIFNYYFEGLHDGVNEGVTFLYPGCFCPDMLSSETVTQKLINEVDDSDLGSYRKGIPSSPIQMYIEKASTKVPACPIITLHPNNNHLFIIPKAVFSGTFIPPTCYNIVPITIISSSYELGSPLVLQNIILYISYYGQPAGCRLNVTMGKVEKINSNAANQGYTNLGKCPSEDGFHVYVVKGTSVGYMVVGSMSQLSGPSQAGDFYNMTSVKWEDPFYSTLLEGHAIIPYFPAPLTDFAGHIYIITVSSPYTNPSQATLNIEGIKTFIPHHTGSDGHPALLETTTSSYDFVQEVLNSAISQNEKTLISNLVKYGLHVRVPIGWVVRDIPCGYYPWEVLPYLVIIRDVEARILYLPSHVGKFGDSFYERYVRLAVVNLLV
jgi:hypothetical protein